MPWSARLSRPLTLKSGQTLCTLRDAGECLSGDRFRGVTASAPLAHAAELLMIAARSGDPEDVAAATDQVEIVLQAWRVM